MENLLLEVEDGLQRLGRCRRRVDLEVVVMLTGSQKGGVFPVATWEVSATNIHHCRRGISTAPFANTIDVCWTATKRDSIHFIPQNNSKP